ncbi:serine protease [Mucilaginibacter sp. BT774]|uniref:S1 family peptidase n=1 Tax=Mucilaginibacter sp. BT774 TaxID=3062276 RepID=UPI0026769D66|nr:serine protease [Mucilaginibacter sp. BT774]MDO3626401.1 serine protease [Mucilaginibacter sp. BT774]
MRDEQLIEAIERYLNGEMTAEERNAFEQLRRENAEIDSRVVEHQQFTALLRQYGERVALEKRLNAIHQEIDVHAIADEVTAHPSWIVQLWRHHHSKISVAASIAIIAVLATLFFSGYLNNNNSYTELGRKVDILNNSNKKIIKSINDIKSAQRPLPSDKYRGTGFAITSNGLIATSYHVISGADSVYVQDVAGRSYKVKVIYNDPQSDVSILKVVDSSFKNLGQVPYTFKRSESDLAENVFTFGFPQDSPVYGDGRLTSANGLNGDTLDYEISVPINPGNSGGPLLDSKGNVIGIVKAKETRLEGVHFALKSGYLLNAIKNIPEDSLTKIPVLNTENTLANLTRQQQVKKIKPYVFMVKVY